MLLTLMSVICAEDSPIPGGKFFIHKGTTDVRPVLLISFEFILKKFGRKKESNLLRFIAVPGAMVAKVALPFPRFEYRTLVNCCFKSCSP